MTKRRSDVREIGRSGPLFCHIISSAPFVPSVSRRPTSIPFPPHPLWCIPHKHPNLFWSSASLSGMNYPFPPRWRDTVDSFT